MFKSAKTRKREVMYVSGENLQVGDHLLNDGVIVEIEELKESSSNPNMIVIVARAVSPYDYFSPQHMRTVAFDVDNQMWILIYR